jgi:hypothetical protein
MSSLRSLGDRLRTDADTVARHTPWLRGAVLGSATSGVIPAPGPIEQPRTRVHPA